MQVAWTRQMHQIKKLSLSSVVFMVEIQDSEASIIASTDHVGYDYDINKSLSISEFGLTNILNGKDIVNYIDNFKFNLKSSLSVAIKSDPDCVWGAIVLLSDKPHSYSYEIEQDVIIFAQTISNSIQLHSFNNTLKGNVDLQSDIALDFFLKSISGVPWRLNFKTKKFIYIGSQAKSILGYDMEDWSSLTEWSNSILPEDREKALNYCYNMSVKGNDHALEYRIVKKNGEILWIKDIVKVITDSTNETLELFGVMINISHTKQSENNLSALNSQLKYILNATNTVLSIIDDNCKIIFHSHTDITSIQQNCYVYFAGRKSMCSYCPRLKKSKTKRTYVDKIGDKTYQVTAFPFEIDLNKWHVAEIRIDITDRVTKENEIMALKDTLEFSMAAGNIGFFEYNIKEKFFKTNKVFKDITGYELDTEYIDADWVLSRFHPDDVENIKIAFSRGANYHIDFECRLLSANNDYIWISYAGQISEYDTDNNPVVVSGVIKDITSTKDLLYDLLLERNRSLRASSAKSTFLANMSHEIRTPMNAIIGFTELLSKHVIEPPFNGYLKSIKSSGKVLLDLINDLLDFEKIEAGKMVINSENTDFKLLVYEIKQTFLILAKEKNVDLIVYGADYFPKSIFVDGLKLRQVLLNLVNNALKFTDSGSVTIQYDFSIHEGNDDGILSFSVTDTGIGVPNEKKQKIFEPFVQEKNQNENKYQGTGLGLSIVQNLIHMMGGSISLVSELGKGSSFSISIPNIKSSAIVGGEFDLDYTDSRDFLFNNELVLIADPIDSNREVLCEMCKSLGFRCISVANGNEALENITEEIDMVIMDLEINEKHEYHTIQKIREQKSLSSLPVLAISTRNKDIYRDKVTECGFSGFVSKPIREKDLVEELSKYFTPINSSDENYEAYIDSKDFTTEDLEYVISEFNTKIIPIWNELCEMLSSEKLNLFVTELKALQDKVTWTDLNDFNIKLDTAIKSFDFETIQKLIRNFNIFIRNLDL